MKRIFLLTGMVWMLMACSSAYYNTMEKFGVYKRDILVDRVEEGRDLQEDAQEQFQSALEQFRSVVQVDETNLDKVYNQLNDEYQDSKSAAEAISQKIDDIEKVASDLFSEWEDELDQYDNASLRRDSAQKLKDTRSRYEMLIKAMRKAESRLDPVLTTMHDQVLYLKHNLNASAIQALRDEVIRIDQDVTALLAAMNQAIEEADRFIRQMRE